MLYHYLSEDLGINNTEMPSAIFFITEDGCPTCDRLFADLVRPRTNAKDCLFIVRAEGRSINMNGFMSETSNLRFDEGKFKQLDLLEGSGLVIWKDQKIDTTISLNVGQLHEQLEYMTYLLDSLTNYGTE